MSYKVLLIDKDGEQHVVYDPSRTVYDDHSLSILEPTLELDIENGGTFDFTIPPQNAMHELYEDTIDFSLAQIMTHTVEVYEDNDVIWTGRPTSISQDFYNRQKVRCEGALDFLHDSIQPKVEYNQYTPFEFASALLNLHNDRCPSNRKIYADQNEWHYQIGNETPKKIWRQTDYESTYDCLQSYILGSLGGYAMVIKKNGRLVLQYWSKASQMPINNQTINLGVNLLDFTRSWDCMSVVTEVIPICRYTFNGTDKVYTVSPINGGKEYVRDDDAFDTYGRITKVIDVEMVKDLTDTKDIEDATEKKEAEQENKMILRQTREHMLDRAYVELNKNLAADLVIEANVADLSKYYVGSSSQPMRLGQRVHIVSAPHAVDATLPISKMRIDLTTGQKQITIGTPKKKNLTEIYKPKKKR